MSPPIIERTYALTIVCARALQIVAEHPFRFRVEDLARCVIGGSGYELAGIAHTEVETCVDALIVSGALRLDRHARLRADTVLQRMASVAEVARDTVATQVAL